MRAVRADGHDVFVELGADSHRANAVKHTGRKQHVAVSIDRRGEVCKPNLKNVCRPD